MKSILTLALAASITNAYGQNEVDYSKAVKASEVAKYFFGPNKPTRIKKPKINVGRIGISAKTKLNCGRLDAVASVNAELDNVEAQLRAMAGQVAGMYSNPSALAMALVCYYKPQVCAYIRHGSLMFNEQLALQYDACESLDKFIDSQADKGMRQLQSESVQKCISDRSGGGAITTKMIRDCQSRGGKMRNLLQPFRTVYASGKQKVLKSIVAVVNEDQHYPMLTKLLGEVEVHQNGHWVKLFPEDQLRASDIPNNFIAASESDVCNTTQLAQVLSNVGGAPSDPFAAEVRKVMVEKFPKEVIRDLSSIPDHDRKSACAALAEGVAEIAVKRSNAKNKAVIASALGNDALPDDLRIFYKERAEMTFSAIQAKIDAEEIKPLAESLDQLRKLALQYRSRNRESASGISAGKIMNESGQGVGKCEDELSCER